MNPPPSIARIVEVTADYYNVSPGDVLGLDRRRHVAFARQVCVYLARDLTRYSLESVAAFLGGRGHSTAHHAVAAIGRAAHEDGSVRMQLDELRRRLAGDFAAAVRNLAAAGK